MSGPAQVRRRGPAPLPAALMAPHPVRGPRGARWGGVADGTTDHAAPVIWGGVPGPWKVAIKCLHVGSTHRPSVLRGSSVWSPDH